MKLRGSCRTGLFACTLGIAFAFALGGCVTTSEGGLPPPASKDARIKAHLDLARGYIRQRSWNDAKTALLKALDIEGRSVEAHTLLALVYEAQEEHDVAERYYVSALRIDRTNAQALNNYGTFLSRQGRMQEAVDTFREVVKDTDYRARPQAYENLGLAELALTNQAAAQEAFERAISLDPRQAVSALELAAIAHDDGKHEVARDYYQHFKAMSRQTARSLCVGIKIALAERDADAVASYRLALKNLYPDSPEAAQCQTPSS